MDYEKKYKEALEKARQLCVYPTSKPFISDLQDLFPELKESEDERIRKELINYLITDEDNGVPKVGQIPIDNVIAWLEKQKAVDVLDAEKKELKIIEQKPADDIETSDKYEGLTDFERTLADICIGWTGERVGWKQYVKDNADILLKFKHKPTWSEYDEEIYSRICYLIHSAAFENYDVDEVGKELGEYAKITDWLKTIKDRVQPQPQQEWSEEDDKNLEKTIWYVEKGGKLIFAKTDELVSWLKSLRIRNKWKPSEKQMEALKDACDEHWEPDGLDPLYTLYQELKKLREE